MKEVLLVGFGAVGALYSLVFKRSGLARVTAVARSNYSIVRDQGVHFKSQKFGVIRDWKPDRLCSSVASAADQAYDYVVVTTKAVPELKRTPEILSPLLSPEYTDRFSQPTYVLLQNGLNIERDLYDAILKLDKGKPSIVGTALYVGTNLAASNVVEHNNVERLSLGVYRHGDHTTTENSADEATLLQGLGSIFQKGGSAITIVPEIQRIKFSKNFWNLSFASFATLTGYTLPSLFRSPPVSNGEQYDPYVYPITAELVQQYSLPAIKAIMKELLALGWAMGFPDSPDGLPSSTVETIFENTAGLHRVPDSSHVPSMLLDARRSQPMEVEVIVGEVVRMGKKYKVDVPHIDMLYALLLVKQNQILGRMAALQLLLNACH
ncbi:6-phosphogluconate dehydrogenase C-terminal domain-like protein [Pleurotus eryngii]|uniref:6-phosphogluconate dehydrogenase C-terminal domain-like protein n=1 Tax=Pleurotus eryngii TaxID=5323 RepID=A0A9P6DEQ6_PLEER|nr:6-phosphogluconate dehydrogenase C-terminal domain-like protein [Pleurotus eryngii]